MGPPTHLVPASRLIHVRGCFTRNFSSYVCVEKSSGEFLRVLLGAFMYALFLEQTDGHREWFCAAQDEERARVVARYSSKYGPSSVVVVKETRGVQTRIAAFRDGQAVPLEH